MKFASFVLAGLASSARIDRHRQTDDSAVDMFMMSQAVSTAAGFLEVTGTLSREADKKCGDMWPKELDKEFKDKYVVGSGATACVYLAKDSTDTLVAVKVGKGGKDPAKRFASWQHECNDMQDLRFRACKAGPEILSIHEQYLPTCTKVEKLDKGAYYVMHAAGEGRIKDVPKLDYSKADRVEAFAGFVTSVYGLHVVGLTHNDLHGQNVVLDAEKQVALIDFGSLKTLEGSSKKGHKRDSNAIWRWAGMLAECPDDAQWSKPPKAKMGEKFLACMKDWSGDEPTFMAVMKELVEDDIEEAGEHHVTELYKTKFIQDNKPAENVLYPWKGTDCSK